MRRVKLRSRQHLGVRAVLCRFDSFLVCESARGLAHSTTWRIPVAPIEGNRVCRSRHEEAQIKASTLKFETRHLVTYNTFCQTKPKPCCNSRTYELGTAKNKPIIQAAGSPVTRHSSPVTSLKLSIALRRAFAMFCALFRRVNWPGGGGTNGLELPMPVWVSAAIITLKLIPCSAGWFVRYRAGF
jgi:hypothetical protein